MPTRPASVTAVIVLLGLAAVLYLAGAIVSIVLLVEPGQRQLFLGGAIDDRFWLLSAALFTALAIVLVLVARSALSGDPGAGVAISLLGLLGAGFSLFAVTHGYGWVILALSLLMLIANQTTSAQQWYRSHGG